MLSPTSNRPQPLQAPSPLLAVSTSGRQGSLCLYHPQTHTPLYNEIWQFSTHSEHIVPAYEKILSSLQLEAAQVQSYALNIGPGSFTGLRVGLNFIRSLAYLFNKKIYKLNSMQILAFELFQKHPDCQVCCIMIDAFKNQIYSQFFTRNFKSSDQKSSLGNTIKSLQGPQCLEAFYMARALNSVNLLPNQKILCAGNGWNKYKNIFLPHLKVNCQPIELEDPKAEVLARWAVECSQPIRWPELQAFYMRASSAEENFRPA